jgi:hypothetical protein
MDIDICPLLEGDMIIPLYTWFSLNQWDEWFRKVREIWFVKLPQGEVIVYLSSAVSVFLLAQWKSPRTTCMTSFNLNQRDEWIRKVREIWLLKLPQRGIVLQCLTGTTGGIVMQLILGWNSKTTVMFL